MNCDEPGRHRERGGPQIVSITALVSSDSRHESAGEALESAIYSVLAELGDLSVISYDGPANRRARERGISTRARFLDVEPATRVRRLIDRLRGWRAAFSSSELAAQDDLLADADIVDVQWIEQAHRLRAIKRAAPHARTVVVIHDVLSQRCARGLAAQTRLSRRLLWRMRLASVRRLERRVLRLCDAGIVLSEKDADLLPRARRSKVSVIRPMVPGGVLPAPETAGEPVLAFLGFMARPENSDAALVLARELLPRVRRVVPGARVVLGGAGFSPELTAELSGIDGVDVRGYVDDLDDFYGSAAVAVMPIVEGAGVKFKVLDALVRGVPVVTTEIGAEGIVPRAGMRVTGEDWDAMAQEIVDILDDYDSVRESQREWAHEYQRNYGADAFRAAVRRVYAPEEAVE